MHFVDALGEVELVRYNRQGKWYLEPVAGIQRSGTYEDRWDGSLAKRTPVTIGQAVTFAVVGLRSHTGNMLYGLPGGSQFDAKVRKAMGLR